MASLRIKLAEVKTTMPATSATGFDKTLVSLPAAPWEASVSDQKRREALAALKPKERE